MIAKPQERYLWYLDDDAKTDLSEGVYPKAGTQLSGMKHKMARASGFPSHDVIGPSPEDAMRQWESTGRGFPATCSDPALLYAYYRGKVNRDLTHKMWREGCASHGNEPPLFQPEEFLEAMSYDAEEFRSVFRRFPDYRALKAWIETGFARNKRENNRYE